MKNVGDFLAQLEAIPWFSRIGQPVPADAQVHRIFDWDQWPGPKTDSILELSLRHQQLYESILDSSSEKDALAEVWNRFHDVVFRVAAPKVPYDPEQDAWHGPTTAVWQAAWTAGLIGLCLHSNRAIPPDLQAQWEWFLRGHWPSGYTWLDDDGTLGPLLVY